MTKNLGLPERYTSFTELGSGGMGTVYKAKDTVLKKTVAIKVLKDNANTSSTQIQRFHQEAKASGKLQHPNIVTTMDFGVTDNGFPYLVMDFIEGTPLNEFIKSKIRLSVQDSLSILIQTSQAMEFAHNSGVVHRDLKSANILVNPNEDELACSVIDFGIAQIKDNLTELTPSNSIVGSPLYMSPEQVSGQKADERSDIYSLGCIMFECLTGSPPFQGSSAMETMRMHKSTMPSDLVSKELDCIDTEIIQALEEIVARALKKNKSERYQKAREFKEDLESTQELYKQIETSKLRQQNIQKESPIIPSIPLTANRSPRSIAFLFLGLAVVSIISVLSISFKASKKTIKIVNPKASEHLYQEPGSKKELFKLKEDTNKIVWLTPNKLITDAEFAKIQNTKLNLERVNLGPATMLTIEGIKHLAGLEIHDLKLEFSEMDSSKVELLTRIKHLQRLYLVFSKLKSNCFKPLTNYRSLEKISCTGCTLEKNCIKDVINIVNLRTLDFRSCDGITIDDIEFLVKAKNITHLGIRKCAIGELVPGAPISLRHFPPEAIKALSKLQVSYLDISDTDINDNGLLQLTKMKNLKILKLYKCDNYSKKGLLEFRKLNPRVKFILGKFDQNLY